MNTKQTHWVESGAVYTALALSLLSNRGRNNMLKQARTISTDLDGLAQDVQSLISATSNAVEETVVAARNRLTALVHTGESAYERLEDSAAKSVKRANEAVHTHPYSALGIALGVGIAIGALIRRRA